MKKACISDADLAQYMANGFSGHKKRMIEKHLLSCPLCREKNDLAVSLIQETSSIDYAPVSEQFSQHIMKMIQPLIAKRKQLTQVQKKCRQRKPLNLSEKVRKVTQWIQTTILVPDLPLQPVYARVRGESQPENNIQYISFQKILKQIPIDFCFQKFEENQFKFDAKISGKNDHPKKFQRLYMKQNDKTIVSKRINHTFIQIGIFSYGQYTIQLDDENYNIELNEAGLNE